MGRYISLRGSGPWRGRSTRSTNDHGDRRLIRILNGYVSGDGHEIRQFPGYHTIFDGTKANNSNGFTNQVLDVVRPVLSSPDLNYTFPYRGNDARIQTLLAQSEQKYLHCFAQVRNRLVIVGESDHRRHPIYDSSRTQLTITAVSISASGYLQWLLQLSGAPAAFTATDAAGAGMHGLASGDVVWVEDVAVVSGSGITQARIDAELNNRFHRVAGIVGAGSDQLLLATAGNQAAAGPVTVTGAVYRTRANRSDTYGSPGITPFMPSEYDRVDDPYALTSYTVTDPLDLDAPATLEAHVAWVANRQRDFDDDRDANPWEGVRIPASTSLFRSVSRRQQRALPYRLNPEVAGNRLILAAPGYHCVFQVPLVVPHEGRDWPDTPDGWTDTEGRGVLWPSNDLHDKPRSLGVPKCLLIDSVYTPAHPGPQAISSTPFGPFNFIPYIVGSGGFPPGDYRIACSYEDEFTGEEGLASEPIRFNIPATTPVDATPSGGYGIGITFIHPGYLFPECLALKLNIYMAPPGETAMGFYMSIPLSNSSTSKSAKYGFVAGGSPDGTTSQVYRTFQLPAITNLTPGAAVDFTRQAPQSRQMPRGAECFRVIRGIGLGIGHSGTHGDAAELFRFIVSANYTGTTSPWTYPYHDELQIRGFRQKQLIQTGTPSTPSSTPALDGPVGIAGRYFPPAYQGVEIWGTEVFPQPVQMKRVDIVRNFRTNSAATPGFDADTAYAQRLKMVDAVYDVNVGTGNAQRPGLDAYLVLPRGQIQVSEPGRPEVTLSAAIQFLDATKDDDGVAIGHYGGQAIICSRQETYSLGWHRAPTGQVPQLVSREFGCIATNSMVEFDGGLAWISERGPVALMGGLEHVGADLEEDFRGSQRRYRSDSKGMMRHCWGAHDRARGLVLWGLVTTEGTQEVAWEGSSYTFTTAPDKARSRFSCDEVLIWSYRANAFSTWRPPSGLEVLWMGELKDKNGDTYLCFLAADHRIYALDDAWHDVNRTGFFTTANGSGKDSTTLVVDGTFAVDGNGGATARGTGENLLRTGMTVAIYDENDKLRGTTTVASLTVASKTVTLTDAMTWKDEDSVEIGWRQPMTIETTFNGETTDTIDLEGVHVRYNLHGPSGKAWLDYDISKTDLASTPDVADADNEECIDLGTADGQRAGRRRILDGVRGVAPEIGVTLRVFGRPQVRITDIALEVAGT